MNHLVLKFFLILKLENNTFLLYALLSGSKENYFLNVTVKNLRYFLKEIKVFNIATYIKIYNKNDKKCGVLILQRTQKIGY